VLPHVGHAEVAQVVRGDAQPDRVADRRRPRLELPGDVVPLGSAEVDLADHLAAGEERRHRLEQLAPGPQGPRAHRAEHLVAAERVEVRAELLDVDRHVRHGLGAVDEDERARGVGHLDHLADRVDRPERVRDVGERDELRLSRRRTSKTSRRRRPSSVIGMNSRSPSFSWTRSCHGTRFAWCSISVRTIASPREMFFRPHE
jgi:hypothetical protein